MPERLPRLLVAPALLALCAAAFGDGSGVTVNVPARNWHLSLWTNAGYLSMTLRGSEVRPVGADRIDIADMDITVFSGDAARRVDTIVISPNATFRVSERRASGPGVVRVIDYRDGIEMTGEDWSYEQAGKKVSIGRRVHVVYHASVNLTAQPAP